ncbi:hypothetical protein [Streptomyces sp. NBC_01353]|nr:hypothetical protein [Streptomyces sp. NBC_01353]
MSDDLTGLAVDELLDLLAGARPGAGSKAEALRELSAGIRSRG